MTKRNYIKTETEQKYSKKNTQRRQTSAKAAVILTLTILYPDVMPNPHHNLTSYCFLSHDAHLLKFSSKFGNNFLYYPANTQRETNKQTPGKHIPSLVGVKKQ